MKDYIKFSSVLGIICLIAGAFLSLVHSVTEPEIQKQARLAEIRSLKNVIPELADYKETTADGYKIFTVFDEQGRIIGYTFLCEAKGYSSTIKIMVGIDAQGNIKGVDIVSQNETPGLGSRIKEADFLSGFKGRSPEDVQEVDTISGATISSRAVIEAVKENLKTVIQSIK